MHIQLLCLESCPKVRQRPRGLKKQMCDFFFPVPSVLKWNVVIGAGTNATACIIAARDISWVLFFLLLLFLLLLLTVWWYMGCLVVSFLCEFYLWGV